MEEVTFVVACKRFFGTKENQSLKDFAVEMRQMTNADKADLTPLLEAALKVSVVDQKGISSV